MKVWILLIFLLGVIVVSGCAKQETNSASPLLSYSIRSQLSGIYVKNTYTDNISQNIPEYPRPGFGLFDIESKEDALSDFESMTNTRINPDEIGSIFCENGECKNMTLSEIRDKLSTITKSGLTYVETCGNPSWRNPKWFIVIALTREDVVRGCNALFSRESKTCSELGGSICLSNERCLGNQFLFGAVDDAHDRCCSVKCEKIQTKQCSDIGGKYCSQYEDCTNSTIIEIGSGNRDNCCIGECIPKKI